MQSMKLWFWGVGLVVVIALILMLSPFTVIGAGEVGVVTRNGAVNRTLDAGLHGITPIIETVHRIDIQTQKEQTEADAASQDLQKVSATVAVNFAVDSSKAANLYTEIGSDYKVKVIDPAIQEAVKGATAQYSAEELITKRPQVTDDIKTALSERLKQYYVMVSSVSVVNFAFSPSFEAAIEAKVTAVQNADAAKNKLAQVQYEAQQTVATAEATAKSISLQSDAANNEKYIQLKELEVQKAFADKWNGTSCQNNCWGAAASSPLPIIQVGGQK